MFFNLKKHLVVWQQHQLITADQVKAILADEEKSAAPWAMYGIAGIGVTALLTGVISIVAANWWDIPVTIKLGGYFLLQAAMGFAFIRHHQGDGLWREISLAVFALLFYAGIGLISQVYNLRGDGWQAIALWTTITLPAVFHAKGKLLSHAWVLSLFAAAIGWASAGRPQSVAEIRWATAAAIPILLAALSLRDQVLLPIPEALRRAMLKWGMTNVILVGSIVGNILWVSKKGALGYDARNYLIIPWTALVLAMVASITRGKEVPKALRTGTASLFFITGVYVTLPLLGVGSESFFLSLTAKKFIGAVGFIVIGLLAAATSALAGYRKLYDTATLAVAIRILIIYAEVFGSLTTTGIGLIFTGFFFLMIVYLWKKHRHKLSRWLAEQA